MNPDDSGSDALAALRKASEAVAEMVKRYRAAEQREADKQERIFRLHHRINMAELEIIHLKRRCAGLRAALTRTKGKKA